MHKSDIEINQIEDGKQKPWIFQNDYQFTNLETEA